MHGAERNIAEEMWRGLRDGVMREWQREMHVEPEVTPRTLTLYTELGSMSLEFNPAKGSVEVHLRRCCDRADCSSPISPTNLTYEPVFTAKGRRRWRRGRFEQYHERMPHMIVYHLLKYRGTV